MDADMTEMVFDLRNSTGCGLAQCKKAVDYARGDRKMAIAYLKAISFAVATPGLTFDERVKRFYEN
ncbi:MAG TPA: hypothetical protein PKB13_05355 [Clostridia bacterium]|nr:hypothetical protein [Clostridia bacterium]